eukprot:1147432-Pelagomonas_calceolata.AAC.11
MSVPSLPIIGGSDMISLVVVAGSTKREKNSFLKNYEGSWNTLQLRKRVPRTEAQEGYRKKEGLQSKRLTASLLMKKQ